MATSHYFDVHIAKLYGVNCAVILQNIWHWVSKNEANGKHFHDGYYWTYNSTKAFSKQFPYLSQRQIETALKKLRDEGILKTGNYNAMAYDRTLWYAITEKGKSILHTGEMEFTSIVNGNNEDVKPIPNINTNINSPYNKPYQSIKVATTEDMIRYEEAIKFNIDYDCLIQQENKSDIDELVSIMVELCCSSADTVVIGKEEKSTEIVKSQMLKLNSEHILYVLSSIRENTTRVKNIKAYLKSCLFNAPQTMGHYYTALVSADMYGG